MDVSVVGIIGAGQMGAGVAQVAAQAGLRVILNDVSEQLCLRGLDGLERNLDRMIQRGRFKADERDRIIRRIETSANLEDLRGVDFVIEAVVEQEEAKIQLFQKLDRICPPEVIFASNTSSISITRMGARTTRADRFIGMHFMNPVPAMRLVEIIRGLATSQETYEATRALAERLGKNTMTAEDFPGFIVNRILLPMINEAIYTLYEGVGRVTDIDTVWVFDLKTKKGKKLDLPGVTFANDPTVMGNALYVSDNRSDQLVRVEPADFLEAKADPKITALFKDKGVNPNGVYPGKGGTLLMVGFKGKDDPRGIYAMKPGKDPELLSDKIGMLDGLYLMSNGDLLATDWVSGSLFQWNKTMGMKKLATDFKGPADFCAFENAQGLMVVVPDLVKGEMRFVQLGK